MFIGACAQINFHENVFVCVSAFVMRTSFEIWYNMVKTDVFYTQNMIPNCNKYRQ